MKDITYTLRGIFYYHRYRFNRSQGDIIETPVFNIGCTTHQCLDGLGTIRYAAGDDPIDSER